MFTLLIISTGILIAEAAKFTILNRESGAIWVGILGNAGQPNLDGGGFVLETGQTVSNKKYCFFCLTKNKILF